jgi:hypothetical protein
MKDRNLIIILVLILAIIVSFGYLAYQGYSPSTRENPSLSDQWIGNDTSTATSTLDQDNPEDLFTMKLYEKRKVKDATINPWAVLEDSRCPANVQCIQAGRVKVAVNISSPYRKVNAEMEPGDRIFVGSFTLRLREVLPAKATVRKIQDNEYSFVFEVLPVSARPPADQSKPSDIPPYSHPPQNPPMATTSPGTFGGCYVGGCSGQICSECERQQNGQCGWTVTTELRACLMNGGSTAN